MWDLRNKLFENPGIRKFKDLYIRILENWEIGKLGNLEIGKLGNSEIRKFGNSEILELKRINIDFSLMKAGPASPFSGPPGWKNTPTKGSTTLSTRFPVFWIRGQVLNAVFLFLFCFLINPVFLNFDLTDIAKRCASVVHALSFPVVLAVVAVILSWSRLLRCTPSRFWLFGPSSREFCPDACVCYSRKVFC